jgi:hypothetical protein
MTGPAAAFVRRSGGYGVFHLYVVSALRRTMLVRLNPDTK